MSSYLVLLDFRLGARFLRPVVRKTDLHFLFRLRDLLKTSICRRVPVLSSLLRDAEVEQRSSLSPFRV